MNPKALGVHHQMPFEYSKYHELKMSRTQNCEFWTQKAYELKRPFESSKWYELTISLWVLNSKAIWLHMGWLRLVGSLKLQVSFAEYSLFYRALLQKRLVILRSLLIGWSLLIVATPYPRRWTHTHTSERTHTHLNPHIHICTHTHTSEPTHTHLNRKAVGLERLRYAYEVRGTNS